jgi:very-short-patch-repair endonuclease
MCIGTGGGMTDRTLAIALRLETAARRQRGLITWRAARAAGLHAETIRGLCSSRRWWRIADGVYAVRDIDGGPLQRAAAELLSAGELAFLQRRTAAVVHGELDLPPLRAVDVAVPRSCSSRRYPKRTVPPEHIVEVKGLRTTDLLQTLLDLAGELDDIEWEWALEAVLRKRRVRIADVEAALAAPGRTDRASVDRVRRVLSLRGSQVPTDSVLETRFVQMCRRYGIPEPERQVEVIIAGGFRTYPDCVWPDAGAFAELDGEGHKLQPVYDSSRQTAIVAATGWLTARFTWTEVVRNPTIAARRLQGVLDQAHRRPMQPL